MTSAAPDPHCGPDGCITCGDVADEMTVLEVDDDHALALCADDRERHHTVEILLVDPVRPGERVLVHAGTALSRLEPEGAAA